ncbi:MAG TPA: GNAT family N-acetyltransferase [Candidatus Nanoarchaeia archaeon]|nr:GNAT family N-acetyltransferase [Candidatus Nanoarchaeia archaeon]
MPDAPKSKSSLFTIRLAEEKDASTLLALIKELAQYEKLLPEVEATEQQVRDSIFHRKAAEAFIGEYKGKAVAYAIIYQNFSSFTARPGIFVEDIYVKPELRRMGFGKLLFKFIAKLAVERGCARMEWTCLDWNAPSIAFYKKLGAKDLTEWTNFRLAGKSLEEMANS